MATSHEDHDHGLETDVGASAPLTTVDGRGGLPMLRVTHTSGASLEVYLFGAQVTSYKTSAGQELLFVSSKAIFDGVKPIRGGIPIAFPQFAAQGPLPMHGFARTSVWTPTHVGDGIVYLRLNHSEATLALWPHQFELVYRIQFDDTRLTTSLECVWRSLQGRTAYAPMACSACSVVNPSGSPGPFSFEALLHTYFYIGRDALDGVSLTGLRGARYIDKPSGGSVLEEAGEEVKFTGETDRVYLNTPADVVIHGVASGLEVAGTGHVFKSIHVHRQATVRDGSTRARMGVMRCPLDVVVWNAGAARAAAMADLGEENYKHYVCVEPGRVSVETADAPGAKALAPGRKYTISQVITMAAT